MSNSRQRSRYSQSRISVTRIPRNREPLRPDETSPQHTARRLRYCGALNDRCKESVARVNAGNCSQVRTTNQGIKIVPDHFTRALKVPQLFPAIDNRER